MPRLTYAAFKKAVAHLSIEEIRCDVPATESTMDLIYVFGLDRWERYAERLDAERLAGDIAIASGL